MGSKFCPICNTKLIKPHKWGYEYWYRTTKFCSQKCNGIDKKGKSPHGWTDEQKEAMSKLKTGQLHSDKTREKMRKSAKRGKDNHLWKGGVSKIDRLLRCSYKYLKWRSDVFERDKYTCRYCGVSGCYVTAHHIKGFSKILQENNITNSEEGLQCQELWDLENGLTLCEECHSKTDNYKGRGSKAGRKNKPRKNKLIT